MLLLNKYQKNLNRGDAYNALQGGAAPLSLSVAGALIIGCAASASSLNYYSQRYVGELALINTPCQGPFLQISVLDFWGRRQAGTSPRSMCPAKAIMDSLILRVQCMYIVPQMHSSMPG